MKNDESLIDEVRRTGWIVTPRCAQPVGGELRTRILAVGRAT